MKNFILIDYIIERIKQLFTLLDTHNHSDLYYTKEEIDAKNHLKQNISKLTSDYKIQEGHNSIVGGPFEIESGTTLEIPKGSTLSVI